MQYILYLHILVGAASLLTGAMAIFSAKGKGVHRLSGRIYFWSMTLVFITGITVAAYSFNHFLFLIAFLSYYSVFAGLRFLRLRRLHRAQNPEWYDWFAGIMNGLANLLFVGYGLKLYMADGLEGGPLLSTGFGIAGLFITYANLKPFVRRPQRINYWYTAHIGNMTGGYIAVVTAFLSTLVSRYQFMNPYLAFALPALIGIPFLVYRLHREEKKYDRKTKKAQSHIPNQL